MTDVEGSQRAYARLAGLMYLVVLALDIAALVLGSVVAGGGTFDESAHRIIASEGLYRVSLLLALAGSLCTVPLAMGLYVAVKKVDGSLALMAMLFRTAESVIGAAGIGTSFAVLKVNLAVRDGTSFDTSQLGALANLLSAGTWTEIAAIFSCVGSTIFFFLFLRSTYLPKALSAWGIFASLSYLAYWLTQLIQPEAPAALALLSLPILIAELATGAWLLIIGTDRPRYDRN